MNQQLNQSGKLCAENINSLLFIYMAAKKMLTPGTIMYTKQHLAMLHIQSEVGTKSMTELK